MTAYATSPGCGRPPGWQPGAADAAACGLAQVPCLICQTPNAPEAPLCQECAAPLALTCEARAQQRPPRIVTVIGESNVGKTVYLGLLLDMLSQRARQYQAIPRGAYSVDLQQSVISHLAWRMFPPKTPVESSEWHWAYYQVLQAGGRFRQRQPRWLDLVMPDMAGEALAAEIAAPSTFGVIRSLLARSSAALLLVDAALAANGSPRPDFFALKLLSYLDAVLTPAPSRARRKAARADRPPIAIPVAVVLCKADYCPECFDDPRRFVQANLNRTWNLCASRLANVAFFAASAVGALAYSSPPDGELVTPVPLHVAPRGILEPFEWVASRL